nr:MAG TPA: hypothetical protein [Caudoviricetes sp.]
MKKYRYKVNGAERTATALSIGKHLTIVIYRGVKHRDRLIQVDRDEFFGTGTTIYIFSRL